MQALPERQAGMITAPDNLDLRQWLSDSGQAGIWGGEFDARVDFGGRDFQVEGFQPDSSMDTIVDRKNPP